jgi:hypothetical protein
MKSTRCEAPYLPSNIDYIANNNALEGREDVSHLHGSTDVGIVHMYMLPQQQQQQQLCLPGLLLY